jgi:hypothetical protein
MHILRLIVAALTATSLSACGDNPADVTPPPPVQVVTEVPASAYASTAAFSTYAAMLAPSDSSEPLKLGSAAAPTSENEEPVPVAK